MSERLQQLYSALSAADKAGNTEDAQAIATAYKLEKDRIAVESTGMRPERQIAPPEPESDNAFQYSIDQAQRMGGKGIEALGRATTTSQLESYGTGVVQQQDQDIAAGGYQPSYTKSLRDTFNEDGIQSAIGWLGEKTAENSVSGGAALIGGLGAAALAPVSAPAAAILGLTTLAGSVAMGAGEAAFEQEEKVGDYDAALSVGQGILIGILDKFGAGKVIPKSRLLTMTPDDVAKELASKGYAQAAKEVIKRTATEGATEIAQEGVSIAGAASRGGEYSQDEVIDRSIESFALGATNAGVAQGVMGTGSALVNGKPANLSDRLAQSTFAQRLDALAKDGDSDGNPYDLNDLDTTSQTGVRALIDAAHASIGAEIQNLESDLSAFLNPNNKSLTSQEKADRVKVKAMLKQARNKTKSVVGAKDFAILKRLVGSTPDGKRLLNLVKESQEQTKVWNAGLVGGVSKYTDLSNPLPTNTNYSGQSALTNSIKGLGTGGLAYTTGGTSLIPQAGIFAGGRIIDKITGRRSKVKRYITKNKGGDGFGQVSGIGERDKNLQKDKKAQDEALAKARQSKDAQRMKHFYNYTNNNPANPESPQGIYERFTGMDRAGLEATIEESLGDPDLDPMIRKEMEDLIESMKYGEKVSGFGALRMINGLIQQFPDTVGKRRVNVPEDQAKLQALLASGVGKESPGYLRGVADNKAFVAELQEKLSQDSSVSAVDKTRLKAVLDKMATTLGKEPLGTIALYEGQLLKAGVPPAAMAAYFNPYKERVIQQQKGRGNTPPDGGTPPEGGSPPQGGGPQPTQPPPKPRPFTPPAPTVAPTDAPVAVTPPVIAPPKPKPKDVKKKLPEAKKVVKLFDIGNEGSIWEQGIATMDDFLALGKALNLTIKISKNQSAFDKFRKSVGFYGVNGKSLRGFHTNVKFGSGGRMDDSQKNIIGVKQLKGSDDLQVLMTLAHEIGHDIESTSKEKNARAYASYNMHPESAGQTYMVEGSFREYLNGLNSAVTMNPTNSTAEKKITDEIDNLQNLVGVFFEKDAALGKKNIRVSWQRDFYKSIKDMNPKEATPEFIATEMAKYKKRLHPSQRRHIEYVKDAAEFATDPIWVYMANPRLMKEIAPNTAKEIQKFFNGMQKDFPVSFHANPVATILAIVMAGMVATGDEEEQQPAQAPQGGLVSM